MSAVWPNTFPARSTCHASHHAQVWVEACSPGPHQVFLGVWSENWSVPVPIPWGINGLNKGSLNTLGWNRVIIFLNRFLYIFDIFWFFCAGWEQGYVYICLSSRWRYIRGNKESSRVATLTDHLGKLSRACSHVTKSSHVKSCLFGPKPLHRNKLLFRQTYAVFLRDCAILLRLEHYFSTTQMVKPSRLVAFRNEEAA